MTTPGISYLDPLVLARIAHLQLQARTVVEGLLSGLHHSSYRGTSLEFAQHREYSYGDELKHLDWKVYGRTDRFFVKQFEQETNLRINLLLDASGSMEFRGQKSGLSKYDYGATLLASLAYLALRQGDSVGIGTLNENNARFVPPRNTMAHLNVILEELSVVAPKGRTVLSQGIENISHHSKKRSLFILVSDLFDDVDGVLRSLKFLRFKKHECMVLHLLDRDEKDFPYAGAVRFDSLESGERIQLDCENYRKNYQDAIHQFIDHYRVSLRNYGIEYHFTSTDHPLDKMLQSVLGARF